MEIIRVLLCGIPEHLVIFELDPMLRRSGYEPEFTYSSGFEEAGDRLKEPYDLLFLGDSRTNPRYHEVVNFAQENPKVPSVMVVSNSDRAVLAEYNNVYPPNATRSYTEVENLSRKEIERLLRRENVPWML